MKVLVTGGNGFIGSQVVRALLRGGHEVVALVRPASERRRIADVEPQLQVVECDVTDAAPTVQTVRSVHPELCIHTAWYAVPGKYPSALENLDHLEATQRLALSLARAGCRRLVGIGSCLEYAPSDQRLSEASPVGPGSLYAAAKLAACTVLGQLGPVVGLEVLWARLFLEYGPFEDPSRLMPSVIRSLLRTEPARLTHGRQVRDYLHVADVGAAVVAAALSPMQGVVNVGSGEPVSVADIARTIGRLLGREDLIRFDAIPACPGERAWLAADNRRLREGTGWLPRYNLEKGLRQTIEWWRSGDAQSWN